MSTVEINELMRRLDVGVTDNCPIANVRRFHTEVNEELFDMHYALEVGVVLDGEMDRLYQGYEMSCEPGDMWLCGVWEPHGFRVRKPPANVNVIMLSPKFPYRISETGKNIISPLFLRSPADRPKVLAERRKEVIRIARSMPSTEDTLDSRDHLKIQSGFLELMLILLTGMELPSAGQHDGELIYSVLDMSIRKNGMVQLEEAVAIAKMPRRRFNEVFFSLVGIPFRTFALRQRLSAAADDLARTTRTLDEIAEQWGFTDKSHLHHRFLEYYKLSPGEYRRQQASEREKLAVASKKPRS